MPYFLSIAPQKLKDYFPYVLGFLLSVWVIYIQHGWINNDSILYFEMAYKISLGQWQEAYEVEHFGLAFYPALIAFTHLVLGLSIQNAANLLNVIFFLIIIKSLLDIVQMAGGDRLTQACAIFILFGSKYIVGDILPMAIRDVGYWACLLLAISQLIKFYLHGRIINALSWQLMALLATLFRIEGMIFLIFLPIFGIFYPISVLHTWQKKITPFLLLMFACLAISIILLSDHLGSNMYLGRVHELLTGLEDIRHNFVVNLSQRVHILQQEVLGEPFKEFAWFSFILTIFCIISIKSFTVAGFSPLVLIINSEKKNYRKVHPMVLTCLIYIFFLAWLIGCLITFKVNLLSSRYVAICGFMLILVASFSFSSHLRQIKRLKSKLCVVLVTLILSIGILGNIKFKTKDYYFEIDAVDYVTKHLNTTDKVFFSNARLRFYANLRLEKRVFDEWSTLQQLIHTQNYQYYKYVVVSLPSDGHVKEKQYSLNNQLTGFKLEKVFYGFKGQKRVLVFKRI